MPADRPTPSFGPPDDPIGRALSEFGDARVERSQNPTLTVAAPGDPRGALPSHLGAFEIERVLGEGGFGVVYLAHQTGPIRRPVALKVLRSPLLSSEAVRRFEVERQVLARLDHPSIATIYEAGTTELGQPYFAMEYVDGAPITAYCEARDVPLQKRLEVFVEVCAAAHHAHGRGIVHRDLKPSNVLVADQGGEPHAKVIDFGIAKLTLEQADVGALRTRTGQILGTPEYMSPEQAEGEPRGLDARSDVYSLGVVLYELVTGTLPLFDRGTEAVGLNEILRTVREVDPPRPSTRILAQAAARGTAGARRAPQIGDPKRLARTVRGGLDWICLKALEKDPDRRYSSARELGEDLERLLDDRAVLARPPSRAYRAARFAHRHRGLVVATSLLIASLVAGMSATAYYLDRAVQSGRSAATGRERAEGQRLAAEARRLAEEKPALSVLLGLEAAERVVDASVRTALLEALPELFEQGELLGHQSGSAEPRWAGDGELIVTGAEDPFLLVWDAESRTLLRRLEGDGAELTAFDLTRDGLRAAASARDGSVIVWEVNSGARVLELEQQSAAVNDLCFDRWGARLATCCADGHVRLFDAATGALVQTCGPMERACRWVVYGGAGEHVAATDGETYTIWRVTDGAPTYSLSSERINWQNMLHAHPTQDLFALTALRQGGQRDERALLVEGAGREVFRGAGLQASGFTPDGQSLLAIRSALEPGAYLTRVDLRTGTSNDLAAVGWNGAVLLADGSVCWGDGERMLAWSADDRPRLLSFAGHRYAPTFLRPAPSGSLLATGSEDRSVKLWDLRAPTVPFRLPVERVAPHGSLAYSAEGLLALTYDPGQRGRLSLYDVERGAVVAEFELDTIMDDAGEARLTPDGAFVVLMDGYVSLLDRQRLPRSLLVYDVAARVSRRIALDHPAFDLALDGGAGRCVVSVDVARGRYEHRWVDLRTGTVAVLPSDTVKHHMRADWDVARDLVVVREDSERGTIRRLADGAPLLGVGGHGGDHVVYAFDDDAARLLSIGVDRSAIVRDTRTGAVQAIFRGLEGVCWSGGFLRARPEGRSLAWAQDWGSIHLFDAETGEAYARLAPVDGQFGRPVESADGRWLFTVTTTGWFQRLPLDPVAYARSVAPRALEPEELEQFHIGEDDERLDRIVRDARRIGTGTCLERAARMIRERGDAGLALTLLEEAVATGTYEFGVWTELLEQLCANANGMGAGPERDAVVTRAVAVLVRAVELGFDPNQMERAGDLALLRGRAEVERALTR